MTPEDLLDLPEDGVERDLIDGVPREWPTTPDAAELSEADLTRRNPERSEAEISIGRDPETFVGIDGESFGARPLEGWAGAGMNS